MKQTSAVTAGLVAVFVAAVSLAGPARRAQAPDSLDGARALYRSAAYEDALAMLERLDPAVSGVSRRDLEAMRALCLVALDRTAEADDALGAVVEIDPLFTFGADVAPRIRSQLDQVRRRMLPDIVRRRYDSAKEAYDRRDFVAAAAAFEEVELLLDDPALATGEAGDLRDLRTLAAGFRHLSLKSVPPSVPVATGGAQPEDRPTGLAGSPPAARAPETAGAKASPGDTVPASAGASQPPPAPGSGAARGGRPPVLVPPEPLDQRPPPWTSSLGLTRSRRYKATVEVVIDENGRVISARIVDSVNRVYDAQLLEAVKGWRYRPGTRDGVPVRFSKLVTITLEPKN